MARYQCPDCSYIYDEKLGDVYEGYKPGTLWSEFDADWPCPDCSVREKVDFVAVDDPED